MHRLSQRSWYLLDQVLWAKNIYCSRMDQYSQRIRASTQRLEGRDGHTCHKGLGVWRFLFQLKTVLNDIAQWYINQRGGQQNDLV